MALVLKDRVKVLATTTGTGTFTLGSAVSGYQDFSVIGNGNTTYYAIVAQATPDWEVGIGTYTASGTTLSRDTILESSNGGTAVNFPAGTKDVFVTYPAERSIYLDSAGAYPVQNTFNTLNAANAVLTAGTVSATPTAATDIVNKTYVDGLVAAGVNYHTPVRLESPNTAGNLNATYNNGTAGVGATLTNAGTQVALTIDGVATVVGDRVLIYNQTNAAHNGVYTVTNIGSGATNWVLTRSTDTNTYGPGPNALDEGSAFYVTSGATGAGETYVCSTVGTITFGTTAITFAQISSAQIYSAGTGLTLTNTTFSISNTGTAGTYGSASQVPVIVTNAQGQVTSATNTAIAIAAGAVSGLAASATTDTTNATNITSGTLPTGRLSGSYTGITGVGTLAAGTWNGSTIAAAYGGTGYASYTIGDILYADTSSTLGKLADVAVGNALISGGVGAAPSWGKIGLATHVSGTLPIANGGTNATATPTAGGVSYGTGTAYAFSAAGTTGQVLTSNGTGAPSWSTLAARVDSISFGTTGLTPATATTGAVTVAGTLVVSNGGTGLTSITANRIPYGNGTSALNTSANLTFDGTTLTNTGNAIISDNSANAALRITQVGAGNALLVEDEANPDSSPFVIDNAGRVLAGQTVSYLFNDYLGTSRRPQFQFSGNSLFASMFTVANWSAISASPSSLNLAKSKSGTVGTQTSVSNGDDIGVVEFSADDGTTFIPAASILAEVDGTPGTNDMPGRLVFSTTADGASSPTEAMRIDSARRVGIGGTATTGEMVAIRNTAETTATVFGLRNVSNINQATTTTVYGISDQTQILSPAALTNLFRFRAAAGGFTGTVTNQYGYAADSTLTGATNNYGFHSNIASGTGRWNFYAAGTADNYFAGQVQLGAGTVSAPALSAFGDTNTGVFFPAADTIAFVEGGTEALRITSTGAISVGSSGTATGTNGQVLTSAGSGAAPTWTTPVSSNITATGLWENAATISSNYTIGTNNNAVSAGPITVASGVVVTVPSGSTWVVV